MLESCKAIRREILQIARHTGHGHIPSCFSVVEALTAVYSVMRHNPAQPDMPGRDVFILSKGHASLAQYTLLAQMGYVSMEEVYTYGALNARFGCHPDRTKIPGVEASTGSLGHGIGLAVGVAMAFQIKGTDQRVYTLVGDGEANEGSVWEAVLVAVDQKLNNLTVIYDNNRSHARGLQIEDPAAHFAGFDCEVAVVDGHDVPALTAALKAKNDRPRAIVANTTKGYGCPSMTENHYAWHRRSPKDDELAALLAELEVAQ
ncbi:MAG: transketolase [Desulfovibrio sp.]|nr:transketolase [Desulfovibrio sp.]MBI4959183.1 transketolase [Desulfovibrio sp.]